MKKRWALPCVVVILTMVAGTYIYSKLPDKRPTVSTTTPPQITTAFHYENAEFGFLLTLPKSWEGYSIVSDVWIGEWEGKIVATGTKLSIRNPNWKESAPRQDIPIMVFTLADWSALMSEKFHIGAAPISPTELGRNARYVFALPARYNFAFPEGFEEVETIIKNTPLTPLP